MAVSGPGRGEGVLAALARLDDEGYFNGGAAMGGAREHPGAVRGAGERYWNGGGGGGGGMGGAGAVRGAGEHPAL
jgi:hypothetical protein